MWLANRSCSLRNLGGICGQTRLWWRRFALITGSTCYRHRRKFFSSNRSVMVCENNSGPRAAVWMEVPVEFSVERGGGGEGISEATEGSRSSRYHVKEEQRRKEREILNPLNLSVECRDEPSTEYMLVSWALGSYNSLSNWWLQILTVMRIAHLQYTFTPQNGRRKVTSGPTRNSEVVTA